MKTKLLALLALWVLALPLYAQTSLSGKVTDDTGEPIIFGSVALYKNGVLITGTETDFDGYYHFASLDPGTYAVETSYVGYTKQRIERVLVYAGKANKLDIEMTADAVNLDEVVVTSYKIPLVEQDNCTQGATIVSDQIRNLPTRNINSLAATTAGVSGAKASNELKIRGSRSNATDYYVDGIRVQGNAIPEQAPTAAGEGYAEIVENEFIAAGTEAFSTFSIDVDKAAYSNVRRFITAGQLPPADAVRTEELINYFDYAYPLPERGNAFAVETELGPCPWQEGHQLLHIGIKGFEASPVDAPPANLVFLIDVSGSMGSANKLPLVKQALGLLTEELRAQDRVSIVTYAGGFQVALLPTPGDQKEQIMNVVNKLGAGGGTAGGAALHRAYELASQYFQPDGSNRVILATDGDFNVGISSPEELEAFIAEKRATGIYLSVLGFGTGNYKDDRLEILANKGNGNYAYIDGIKEAEKVLVTEMAGTLFAIAKDVKLQVEFDSNTVQTYRLIGYENRLLAKEDFEDDTKDAGELGAGHTVTALYEIVPQPGAESEPLGTLHLRYKEPAESQSRYLKHELPGDVQLLEQTSENFRFAAAVATYAHCLRDSKHKGLATLSLARELADQARQDDLENYRADFVELIKQTENLTAQLATAGQK
ncbi:von Willebrand factor type A domain-containing protein [Phaeodactylibacter sp.]|uniref:vWA domain-containing protein n=1 Tax=Phaeodactylibacter sp. TaxID=1940289 RepID=UPI0025F93B91|nr:von Willebrand factor type A domain-containing protein [Phaeodactylibacter sp.]MCI4650757.1 von Willebrand factor type A domain-containing protein [Phaeodactylibacter sp.]MCI5093995.1 von Willebrand factor type A domain-containing protein [Phaeodactylibacter sp.]